MAKKTRATFNAWRLYNVSLPQSKKVAASKKLEWRDFLSLALFDLAKTFIQIQNKGIYRIKAMHLKAVRSNIENSVQKIIYGNPSKSDFEQIWDEEIKRERSFISHLEHLEKILKSASWKSNRLEQAKSTLVETDRLLWDVYTGNVDTVNKIAQLKAARKAAAEEYERKLLETNKQNIMNSANADEIAKAIAYFKQMGSIKMG